MLGRNCFEEKDFHGSGKTIFFRESSERFITLMVKKILLQKQILLVMRNRTNITHRDSQARETIVTFLETSPALFARRLINLSQI